jgi:predicted TPR repeat methyltransferase
MGKKSKLKEHGAEGFSDAYWEENYSCEDEMDGISNAKEHAAYLKNLFSLDLVDVSSIIDYGAGLGYLFEEMMRSFVPYKAVGIEPSDYAFKAMKNRDIKPVESTRLKLLQIDLVGWFEKGNQKYFDLGICTSVLQYLTKEELEFVVPAMARQCKYVYLSVPTDKELDRQVEDVEFHDRYAKRRSRKYYQKLLRKEFTFISSRVLESKFFFDEDSTNFTELLYRY